MANKRQRKAYVQGEVKKDFRSRVSRPHVSQEYQETQRSDIAYELCRKMRQRYRLATIGAIHAPGEAFSS